MSTIEKGIIIKLIEDIALLSASDFEILGNHVISKHEDIELVHHGINAHQIPVKGTVDSFSQSSNIIVEYSIDKAYFTDTQFRKIQNDISHAFNFNDKVEKIYLLSSQVEPPSFREKFNQSEIFNKHSKKITIYDARELAKLILEQSIQSSIHANFYKNLLPLFAIQFTLHAYAGNFPNYCANHVSDQGIISNIEKHFEEQNICILSGISGSGKTQATIDYINKKYNQYDNILWIQGDDWKQDQALSSIRYTRTGQMINIEGNFNHQKTLLVIDSLERTLIKDEFDILRSGFEKGGNILITSQLSQESEIYLAMPQISKEVAFKILDEVETPSEKAHEFVQICAFSPLILATTRSIINETSANPDEVYKEILEAPNSLCDKSAMNIMKRVLQKLPSSTYEALVKIANSGSSIHDSKFLENFIKILPTYNLKKLSILLNYSINTYKVHDLIIEAVKNTTSTSEIACTIERYLGSKNGEMTSDILREIHLCYEQLRTEYYQRNEKTGNWLTYALLAVKNDDLHEDICYQLRSTPLSADMSLAQILCIVEANDNFLYTKKGKTFSNDERENFYDLCLAQYQGIIDDVTDNEIKANLLHHCGKAFRRKHQFTEAIEYLNQTIEIKPDWYVAYGQIVKVGSNKNANKEIKNFGEDAFRYLLEVLEREETYFSLQFRLVLSLIKELSSYPELQKIVLKNEILVRKFANILSMAALEGFEQFFESYFAFSSLFSYNYQDLFCKLALDTPLLLTTTPEMVTEGKYLIKIAEGLINTSIALKMSNPEFSRKFAQRSLMFADYITYKEKFIPYQLRALVKIYINVDKPERGLELVDYYCTDPDHWILYRKAEAELILGQTSNAINSAKLALQKLNDDIKQHHRKSAYYHLLAKCYFAEGLFFESKKNYEIAISLCSDAKYRKTLQSELETLNNQLNS